MTRLIFGGAEAAKVLEADKQMQKMNDALPCRCGGEPELITVRFPENFVMYYVRCKKCRWFITYDYESCEIAPNVCVDISDAIQNWNDWMEMRP